MLFIAHTCSISIEKYIKGSELAFHVYPKLPLNSKTSLTFWHKHRYCQSTDSSSELPLLCPETHILLLVALPSLFYDLGVEGKEGEKKNVLHLHFCTSTLIYKATTYVFCAMPCKGELKGVKAFYSNYKKANAINVFWKLYKGFCKEV